LETRKSRGDGTIGHAHAALSWGAAIILCQNAGVSGVEASMIDERLTGPISAFLQIKKQAGTALNVG